MKKDLNGFSLTGNVINCQKMPNFYIVTVKTNFGIYKGVVNSKRLNFNKNSKVKIWIHKRDSEKIFETISNL